jgi:hypothetical protein
VRRPGKSVWGNPPRVRISPPPHFTTATAEGRYAEAMNTQAIVSEIESVVSGIQFPAHKDDVVSHAQEQGASQETVQTLQKLPSQHFGSMQEILSRLPMEQIEGRIGRFLSG